MILCILLGKQITTLALVKLLTEANYTDLMSAAYLIKKIDNLSDDFWYHVFLNLVHKMLYQYFVCGIVTAYKD